MSEHVYVEHPASITFKISYRGFDDVLFTLRAESGLDLLAKIDPALDKMEKMGIRPGSGRRPARNGPSAPAANGNGDGHVCPTHGTPMKASKFGGYYCPEKIADSGGGQDGSKPIYCKAKIKA